MRKSTLLEKIKSTHILFPLLIVSISCSLLIVSNYFTIKILSASRAYINGESHYSKAQKDATRHIITYLYTKDISEWKSFNEELSVPIGDQIARIALMNNGTEKSIKEELRKGRNNEKDFDDLIWLFKNFKSISFFKKALKEWIEGDQLINELALIGKEVNHKITTNSLDEENRKNILKRINILSIKLTQNQQEFSEALGSTTRIIKKPLLIINIFFTLIIIGSVGIYFSIMVENLRRSNVKIEEANKNLVATNKELDKFVYSASHDLRSPILSLKGLIAIIKNEEEVSKIKNYLEIMEESLNKQDQFIKDIIDYSRNKKAKTNKATVYLNQIIEEAISLNQFREELNRIEIIRNLNIDKLFTDELKLKIIINNLLTNAIKYADLQKEKPFIRIDTFEENNQFKIIFEDNGIGIKQEYQKKIFDMFFVTNHNNKGSGLGLYLVKDTIDNLNGTIQINSEINIGTKFTVTLPKITNS